MRKCIADISCDLHSQAGLARAARPCQGQEANGRIAQQLECYGDLLGPAKQRCRRQRQLAAVGLARTPGCLLVAHSCLLVALDTWRRDQTRTAALHIRASEHLKALALLGWNLKDLGQTLDK